MKNKAKKLNKISGVTMVALVVSIIILLILAGIVITLSVGDNGIIARAKKTAEIYKEVEKNEQIQLSNLSNELASYKNNGGSIEEITESLKVEIISSIYPIGSIYMSTEISTKEEMENKFGGEWEQIKDTFLLGAGDEYDAGTTGGEASHTLTIEEMPEHNHSITGTSFTPSSWAAGGEALGGTKSVATTNKSGGSQAHNNMPPYLTVYMYKRIN